MRFKWIIALFFIGLALPAAARDEARIMEETFETEPETRWTYFGDNVMGGISSGKVEFVTDDAGTYARLTGDVSTENNGGFIQIRHTLDEPPSDDVQGIRIIVRGNGETYFVHLRTRGMMLPWQYYQAEFETTSDSVEVRLPLSDFVRSGSFLSRTPRADRISSVGIVAYGRDHSAYLEVLEIGFY